MGYTIYLMRQEGAPIDLEAWSAVVEAHPKVRLFTQTHHVLTNPVTGEQIAREATPGDAEIQLDAGGPWVPALKFDEEVIYLNAPRDFDDADSPLRVLLRELAADLGAAIVGEADETYE